jgi:DNA repair protein SbcD/Mre11
MRIVHTSDWHAGRIWKGINRLPELEAVLDHLARFVERERIDLLLMSGDVFEGQHPSGEAERVVFEFFKRIGRADVHSVVIAGNHDHPTRVEAWGSLAELVNVRTLGLPKSRTRGGLIEVRARGERALVAAVPFASASRLVSATQLAADETLAMQRYSEGMHRIFEQLSAGFAPDAVNVLMAHTYVTGAEVADHDRSERPVHLGEDWAISPRAIPRSAHYVALGHIHRPQRITAAAAPTFYAGSPMQLDFGEVGQKKTFVVIDASAGKRPKFEHIPYEGAQPLIDVRLSFDDIERNAANLTGLGHMRVTVPVDTIDPDINRKVRSLLPNAVVVPIEVPDRDPTLISRPLTDVPPRDLFAAYYLRTHGTSPCDGVLAEFDRLYETTPLE